MPAGIGLTLALQRDMRIAAIEGKYGVAQVRRGVMPDAYSHWTLPRLVGLERAAYLMLTGRIISGTEAIQIGIASRALPASGVLPAALALTRADVVRKETELHHHLMGLSDAVEGPMAWIERRAPQWKLSAKNDWPAWPS